MVEGGPSPSADGADGVDGALPVDEIRAAVLLGYVAGKGGSDGEAFEPEAPGEGTSATMDPAVSQIPLMGGDDRR